MEYTKNYHLPQWKEDDRIMMRDFNQMCADMEKGLTEVMETAEKLPYVVGTYTGNGGTQDVTLGFMPSVLMIRLDDTQNVQTDRFTNFAITGGLNPYVTLLLTETGFQVIYKENMGNSVNTSNKTYVYVAFR